MNNANKLKIALVAGVLLAVGGIGSAAFADSHLDGARDQFRAIRTEIHEQREDLRAEFHEKESDFRENVHLERGELINEVRDAEPEVRMERMKAFREDVADRREVLREEIRDKREAFRVDAKERIDALREHVGKERAERIEKFFENMVHKFEGALDRLRALADRIEGRLNKFEDLGKDVNQFRETLEDARVKIAGAEDALSAAKEEFGSMVLDKNPREAFKAVKDLVHTIVVEVKDAHAALVDVIHSIKGSSGRLIDEKHGEEEEEHEEENGTSTPDN